MRGGAGVALGTVAGQALADRHPWLPVGSFPQRLALADEPDGLAVGRAFLAVGLAAGAISIGRLGGWRRCFPGSGIGRGRGGRRASGLVGDGRRGRGDRLAQAGGSGILPAGTGLVGHDVPFSCSNEISDSVEPGDHDGARCGSEFLKRSSRCCELERPFVAGVLRHREDWNRYAKRTLGKNFHQISGTRTNGRGQNAMS